MFSRDVIGQAEVRSLLRLTWISPPARKRLYDPAMKTRRQEIGVGERQTKSISSNWNTTNGGAGVDGHRRH